MIFEFLQTKTSSVVVSPSYGARTRGQFRRGQNVLADAYFLPTLANTIVESGRKTIKMKKLSFFGIAIRRSSADLVRL